MQTSKRELVLFNITSLVCFILSLFIICYMMSGGGGRDLPLHLGAPLAAFSTVAILLYVRLNRILKDDAPTSKFNVVMPAFGAYLISSIFLPGAVSNDILLICFIIASIYQIVFSFVEYNKTRS